MESILLSNKFSIENKDGYGVGYGDGYGYGYGNGDGYGDGYGDGDGNGNGNGKDRKSTRLNSSVPRSRRWTTSSTSLRCEPRRTASIPGPRPG